MTPDQLTNLLLIHPDPVSVVVELAKTITPESAKATASGTIWYTVWSAAWLAGREATYDAAKYATYSAVCGISRDAAEDAGVLAGACAIRDLIAYDRMHVLTTEFCQHLPVDESVNQC